MKCPQINDTGTESQLNHPNRGQEGEKGKEGTAVVKDKVVPVLNQLSITPVYAKWKVGVSPVVSLPPQGICCTTNIDIHTFILVNHSFIQHSLFCFLISAFSLDKDFCVDTYL
jgi:hypothetical protein